MTNTKHHRNFKRQGRPLSAVLSKIILQSEEDNRQILTPADFVEFYKISSGYARKMIAELVNKGWLVRIAKGQYQLQPAKTGLKPYPLADKFITAGQLSRDGFIAFGSAAEYHGLTTQVFQSVIVATPSRTKVSEHSTIRIEYIHINPDNFVGFQAISKAPDVKVATLERTLIDAIDRPELCGGISDVIEILKRGRSQLKVDKILEYLPTYNSKSVVQRVGYLLELFKYQMTTQQETKLQKLSKGNYAYLFSRKQLGTDSQPRYSKKWRLVINAPGFDEQEQNRK